MQAKHTETKNKIMELVHVPFKIISVKNDVQLYLIEVEDGQLLVVNLIDNTIHTTKSLDSGIDFEGTRFVLDQEIKQVTLYQNPYNRDQLMDKVMKILNLTTTSGWSIVDSRGKLHLVHYTENANMREVGHLRGVLVDVEKERIIASSFGYTPTANANELVFNNDEMTLTDEMGEEHVFNTNDTIIKKFSEGTILRVIYYEGQVYTITHKKIRPMKSRYGNSPYFTKIYRAGGGPSDDELFDLTKESSPYCYVFLVIDPTLLIASRQHVKSPYVAFLTINKMWSLKDGEEENVEQVQKYDIEPNDVGAVIDEPMIHKPKMLSVEEANAHLQHGYYPPCAQITDLRQAAGEAVILYKINEDGEVIDIVKVNSVGYDYRFRLRGNDPNPYHRFYDLVPHSYHLLNDYVNYTEYKQKFIVFDNYGKDDLLGISNHVGFILYLQESEMPLEERKNRQYILKNIWLNFVLSLPFSFQAEAIKFLDQFHADRYGVINWLQDYQSHNNFVDDKVVSERGKNIIISARYTAKDICKQQPQKKYHVTVNEVIRNFILKEYGSSLFTLVKKWKDHKMH